LAARKKNPRDARAIASDVHNGRMVTVRLGRYKLPQIDDSLCDQPAEVVGDVFAKRGAWVHYEPDDGRADGWYWHTPTVTWETPTQPVTTPTLVRGWYCPAYFLVEGFDLNVRLLVQNVAASGPARLEIVEVLTVGKNGTPIAAEQQRLPLGKLTELVRIAARVAGVLYPYDYDGPGYGAVNGRLVELRDAKGNPQRARTATAEQLAQHDVPLRPALWGRDAVTAKELTRTRTSGPRMIERDLRAAELADEPAARGSIHAYVQSQLAAEGHVIGGLHNVKKAIQRGRKLRAERSTKNMKKKGGKK
jgi:hypothetical protein